MTTDKTKKNSTGTKSPPAPNISLDKAVAESRKLFEKTGRNAVSKSELASVLGHSATSSTFTKKIYTLEQYGLLSESGGRYVLTDEYTQLAKTDPGSDRFKSLASRAVTRPEAFRGLLEEFSHKLPERDLVAQRLAQRGFSESRADDVARVFEESMRHAGRLDSRNNILPAPSGDADAAGSAGSSDPDSSPNGSSDPAGGDDDSSPRDAMRKTEVPFGIDRTVIVRYPFDITEAEAKKVGAVLAALAIP